jgi:hypothetical protein
MVPAATIGSGRASAGRGASLDLAAICTLPLPNVLHAGGQPGGSGPNVAYAIKAIGPATSRYFRLAGGSHSADAIYRPKDVAIVSMQEHSTWTRR